MYRMKYSLQMQCPNGDMSSKLSKSRTVYQCLRMKQTLFVSKYLMPDHVCRAAANSLRIRVAAQIRIRVRSDLKQLSATEYSDVW